MPGNNNNTKTTATGRRPSIERRLLLLISFTGWTGMNILHGNRSSERNALLNAINDSIVTTRTCTLNTANVSNHQHEMIQEGQHYHWVDNQWIPPRNVPHYTPIEMATLFQSENAFWIGDSTSRRAYATMFAMIQGAITQDTSELGLDYSRETLDSPSIIDVNRRKVTERCTHRIFDPKATVRGMLNPTRHLCRQIPGSLSNSRMVQTTPTNKRKKTTRSSARVKLNGTEIPRSGVYDSTTAYCFKDVLEMFRAEDKLPLGNHLAQEYSVLIMSVGVWDVKRPEDCLVQNNVSRETLAIQVLDMLHNRSKATGPTIVWRTSGHVDMPQYVNGIEALNDVARSWFHTHQPDNMLLVDWGRQMRPRSFGAKRIAGDMEAHYGLEARTLMAQMITHELVKLKRRKPLSVVPPPTTTSSSSSKGLVP